MYVYRLVRRCLGFPTICFNLRKLAIINVGNTAIHWRNHTPKQLFKRIGYIRIYVCVCAPVPVFADNHAESEVAGIWHLENQITSSNQPIVQQANSRRWNTREWQWVKENRLKCADIGMYMYLCVVSSGSYFAGINKWLSEWLNAFKALLGAPLHMYIQIYIYK